VTVGTRPHWPVLGGIGVAVLALHIAALVVLGPAWLDPEGPPAIIQRMQVRSVAAPSPTAPPIQPTVQAPALETPRLPARARVAPTPATVGVEDARRDAAASVLSTPAEPVAEAAPLVVDIPVYATLLPPAGRWRYRLQRGLVVGDAELDWVPMADARYELHLQGRVAGVTLLEWASQGQIDAAGVAPERFAVRRRGRDRQAANFQRAPGKITFSGPTHELPWVPGVQDRLSWMLQLPAIVAAAPERFGAGTTVLLFVAGARGDGDVWAFVVQGLETLGDTPALKLVREPRRLYDTRAEVWLDPADHFLPLRLLQTPTGGGAALELQREREPR
jgi:hypothetical protein